MILTHPGKHSQSLFRLTFCAMLLQVKSEGPRLQQDGAPDHLGRQVTAFLNQHIQNR